MQRGVSTKSDVLLIDLVILIYLCCYWMLLSSTQYLLHFLLLATGKFVAHKHPNQVSNGVLKGLSLAKTKKDAIKKLFTKQLFELMLVYML